MASLNARLRFNVRDGTDLWIVYNEAIPVSQGRAVMVKYTDSLVW